MVECEPSKFDAPVRFRHPAQNHQFFSECRESNPDLTHPMGKYYRYTTPRIVSGCRESNSDLTLPKRIYYHYTTARIEEQSTYLLFRNAENRTRISRTRSVYTTTVLHSVVRNISTLKRVYQTDKIRYHHLTATMV